MFYFFHLRHQVGGFNQLRVRVAAGSDYVRAFWSLGPRVDYLFRVEHLVADHVIDFVEHDEIVLFAVDLLAAELPGLLAHAEVLRIGFRSANLHKSAAHGANLELIVTEHFRGVELAIVPRALDELHHQDPEALAHGAKRGAESAGRLALAGSDVNDQQPFAFRHSPPPRDDSFS